MAGRSFFLLICCFCEIQVQASPPQPRLIINAQAITETDSITINCVPPSSSSQCHYDFGGNQKALSCMETLTGTKLLEITHQSSPTEIKVKCFYSKIIGGKLSPSQSSATSSIFIHRQRPELSHQHFPGEYVIFICSLPGSAGFDTRCHLYFGETSSAVQAANITKKTNKKQQSFCQFTVTISDLLRGLNHVQQKDASCDFTSGDSSLSPRSDGISMMDIVEKESSMIQAGSAPSVTTDQNVDRPGPYTTVSTKQKSDILEKEPSIFSTVSDPTMTTDQSTDQPVPSTTVSANKKASSTSRVGVTMTPVSFISSSSVAVKPSSETWKWEWVATSIGVSVGVIFLALMLLCSKKVTEQRFDKRKQGKAADQYVSMKNLGLLSPAGDQTYSIPTSAPVAYCPNGSEQFSKEDPQTEDPDEYHIYSTIPENQPPPAQDMMYSTVQAH